MEGTGRVAPAPGRERSCLLCSLGPQAAPSLPQALGLPSPLRAGCRVPREVVREPPPTPICQNTMPPCSGLGSKGTTAWVEQKRFWNEDNGIS